MKARQRLLLFTVFFLSLLPFCSRAEEAPITEEAFFNLAMGEGKNYSESEEKKLLQGLEQGYSVNARGGSRTVFMQIVRRASTPDLVRAALMAGFAGRGRYGCCSRVGLRGALVGASKGTGTSDSRRQATCGSPSPSANRKSQSP